MFVTTKNICSNLYTCVLYIYIYTLIEDINKYIKDIYVYKLCIYKVYIHIYNLYILHVLYNIYGVCIYIHICMFFFIILCSDTI